MAYEVVVDEAHIHSGHVGRLVAEHPRKLVGVQAGSCIEGGTEVAQVCKAQAMQACSFTHALPLLREKARRLEAYVVLRGNTPQLARSPCKPLS